MSAHRTLGAGMTCLYHANQGLVGFEPSLQTGRFDAPLGWSGEGRIAPNSFDAEPRYRQSHERGCCP